MLIMRSARSCQVVTMLYLKLIHHKILLALGAFKAAALAQRKELLEHILGRYGYLSLLELKLEELVANFEVANWTSLTLVKPVFQAIEVEKMMLVQIYISLLLCYKAVYIILPITGS